jgi:dTDP-4-amino-4,6-dideoxygalactose transaminase
MINVTKTYLPPFEEYTAILKRAWDKGWVTNNGELVKELEQKLKEYLGVQNLLFTCNGTVVLQMALKAFGITKEVITTPFSYVATTNAILWEGCTPVFVDIDSNTLCIDAGKIEEAITQDTQAILATHVYGLPCDVEMIQDIAARNNLKVIYDGAHAFGCTYKGKSLLNYGDISTCSFHATKLFHTVEGGCVIANDIDINEKLLLYRSFGHRGDDYYSVGINGKNSELHAAMGLALLPKLPDFITERKTVFEIYNALLPKQLKIISHDIASFEYNYSYCPVTFESEKLMHAAKDALLTNDVNTRRYFNPSLNLVPQVTGIRQNCTLSEDISSRVLCLPLYCGLKESEISMICSVIKHSLK